MTPVAEKALRASIAHWERNVAAETPDEAGIGSRHCRLCAEYTAGGCIGCPVSIKTGHMLCAGSPYDTTVIALPAWRLQPTSMRVEWKAAAQAELDFLKSLLPESSQ